jgi:hypothetical protein
VGQWTRTELEDAFERYRAAAAKGGETGDWNDWVELFSDDATYVEHHYGTMHGREAIRGWIQTTMSTPPGDQMPSFPIEWHVVDEDRGWIVCQVWNRMADPGDGSVHQEYNFTLLKYAGDGRWSYEEDIYNPARFAAMIKAWHERKAQLSTE